MRAGFFFFFSSPSIQYLPSSSPRDKIYSRQRPLGKLGSDVGKYQRYESTRYASLLFCAGKQHFSYSITSPRLSRESNEGKTGKRALHVHYCYMSTDNLGVRHEDRGMY